MSEVRKARAVGGAATTKVTIQAAHGFDEGHVREVVRKMRRLGPPTVPAVRAGDVWHAVDATRRLEAASRLGLPLKVEDVSAVCADAGAYGAVYVADATVRRTRRGADAVGVFVFDPYGLYEAPNVCRTLEELDAARARHKAIARRRR